MADEPEAVPAAPKPAAPVAAPAPEPVIAKIDHFETAIKEWLVEHIHNSPVSRVTDAYNHLVSVLPHLKAKLAKEG